MIRNIKVLGLAVVAVLAMSAVAASAASAAEFHSESENTTFTGTSEAASVFDAAGATISCPSATFSGTATANTTSSLTVNANYNPGGTKCTFLFFNVTVNMNGCDYVFHADGSVDVAGTNCAGITFEGAGCKVTVTAQSGLKGVTYTNKGTGTTREVTVDPSVTGITYHAEGLCPKTGTYSDGNYTSGPATITGEETGTSTHKGVWWE